MDWGLAKILRAEVSSDVREADPQATVFESQSQQTLPSDCNGNSVATGHGTVMGTPGYMSPEQRAGRGAFGARSDIYGLGSLLRFLLSRHRK